MATSGWGSQTAGDGFATGIHRTESHAWRKWPASSWRISEAPTHPVCLHSSFYMFVLLKFPGRLEETILVPVAPDGPGRNSCTACVTEQRDPTSDDRKVFLPVYCWAVLPPSTPWSAPCRSPWPSSATAVRTSCRGISRSPGLCYAVLLWPRNLRWVRTTGSVARRRRTKLSRMLPKECKIRCLER